MREMILIIICIFLYGCATFFKRLGLAQLHPYQFLLVTGICYAVIIPVWCFLLRSQTNVPSYTGQSILYVVIYSSFSVVAGLALAFLLQRTSAPGTLIVMTNLSSLVTLLLAYLFLGEQLNVTKLVAVLLAIISLFLMNC
jgi:uncharacterized membrane protein